MISEKSSTTRKSARKKLLSNLKNFFEGEMMNYEENQKSTIPNKIHETLRLHSNIDWLTNNNKIKRDKDILDHDQDRRYLIWSSNTLKHVNTSNDNNQLANNLTSSVLLTINSDQASENQSTSEGISSKFICKDEMSKTIFMQNYQRPSIIDDYDTIAEETGRSFSPIVEMHNSIFSSLRSLENIRHATKKNNVHIDAFVNPLKSLVHDENNTDSEDPLLDALVWPTALSLTTKRITEQILQQNNIHFKTYINTAFALQAAALSSSRIRDEIIRNIGKQKFLLIEVSEEFISVEIMEVICHATDVEPSQYVNGTEITTRNSGSSTSSVTAALFNSPMRFDDRECVQITSNPTTTTDNRANNLQKQDGNRMRRRKKKLFSDDEQEENLHGSNSNTTIADNNLTTNTTINTTSNNNNTNNNNHTPERRILRRYSTSLMKHFISTSTSIKLWTKSSTMSSGYQELDNQLLLDYFTLYHHLLQYRSQMIQAASLHHLNSSANSQKKKSKTNKESATTASSSSAPIFKKLTNDNLVLDLWHEALSIEHRMKLCLTIRCFRQFYNKKSKEIFNHTNDTTTNTNNNNTNNNTTTSSSTKSSSTIEQTDDDALWKEYHGEDLISQLTNYYQQSNPTNGQSPTAYGEYRILHQYLLDMSYQTKLSVLFHTPMTTNDDELLQIQGTLLLKQLFEHYGEDDFMISLPTVVTDSNTTTSCTTATTHRNHSSDHIQSSRPIGNTSNTSSGHSNTSPNQEYTLNIQEIWKEYCTCRRRVTWSNTLIPLIQDCIIKHSNDLNSQKLFNYFDEDNINYSTSNPLNEITPTVNNNNNWQESHNLQFQYLGKNLFDSILLWNEISNELIFDTIARHIWQAIDTLPLLIYEEKIENTIESDLNIEQYLQVHHPNVATTAITNTASNNNNNHNNNKKKITISCHHLPAHPMVYKLSSSALEIGSEILSKYHTRNLLSSSIPTRRSNYNIRLFDHSLYRQLFSVNTNNNINTTINNNNSNNNNITTVGQQRNLLSNMNTTTNPLTIGILLSSKTGEEISSQLHPNNSEIIWIHPMDSTSTTQGESLSFLLGFNKYPLLTNTVNESASNSQENSPIKGISLSDTHTDHINIDNDTHNSTTTNNNNTSQYNISLVVLAAKVINIDIFHPEIQDLYFQSIQQRENRHPSHLTGHPTTQSISPRLFCDFSEQSEVHLMQVSHGSDKRYIQEIIPAQSTRYTKHRRAQERKRSNSSNNISNNNSSSMGNTPGRRLSTTEDFRYIGSTTCHLEHQQSNTTSTTTTTTTRQNDEHELYLHIIIQENHTTSQQNIQHDHHHHHSHHENHPSHLKYLQSIPIHLLFKPIQKSQTSLLNEEQQQQQQQHTTYEEVYQLLNLEIQSTTSMLTVDTTTVYNSEEISTLLREKIRRQDNYYQLFGESYRLTLWREVSAVIYQLRAFLWKVVCLLVIILLCSTLVVSLSKVSWQQQQQQRVSSGVEKLSSEDITSELVTYDTTTTTTTTTTTAAAAAAEIATSEQQPQQQPPQQQQENIIVNSHPVKLLFKSHQSLLKKNSHDDIEDKDINRISSDSIEDTSNTIISPEVLFSDYDTIVKDLLENKKDERRSVKGEIKYVMRDLQRNLQHAIEEL